MRRLGSYSLGGVKARAAFTLVELVLTLGVMAILMLAAGSATTLTGRVARSMADPNAPAAQAVIARAVSAQVLDDLKTATAITEQTATAITVVVPDQTGDGVADTIRYAWSGSPDYTLSRQINGGQAVTIATNVRTFGLSYLSKTVGPPAPVESAELLLSSYTGTANNTNASSLTVGASQAIDPSALMPANASSWKITRAKVMLKRTGIITLGNVIVQVKAVDGFNKPTGAVLGSASIPIASLSTTNAWVDVPLGSVGGLSPYANYALVVTSDAVLSASAVACTTGISPALTDRLWSVTSTGGVSWSGAAGTTCMSFYVYGTITTQN